MTFKKEISFDGAAVILATIGLVAWLVTIKNAQDVQSKTLADHSVEIKEIHSTLVSEQLRNVATDDLQKVSGDHETRIRALEHQQEFLKQLK